jgi:hypothetical protein
MRPALLEQRGSRWSVWQFIGAALIYGCSAFLLFGTRVMGGFSRSYIGANGPDPKLFIWSIGWWSRTPLLSGLYTRQLWAPEGYNLGWATTVPAPSVLVSPITREWGAIASFNLLVLVGLTLNGLAVFHLCIHQTGRFWAALFGGGLFLTSTYAMGHVRGGQLNLLLVFPIPWLALLVIRMVSEHARRMKRAVLTGLLAALLYLISPELFADSALVGALWLGIWIVHRWRAGHVTVDWEVLRYAGVASLITLLLIAPALIATVSKERPVQDIQPDLGSVDAANLFVPTSMTWIRPFGLNFPATGSESDETGYVGLASIALVALFARAYRRTPAGFLLLFGSAVILVLALGPRLTVWHHPSVPLPWMVLERLPLIGDALPGRLMVFAFIALALMAATLVASAPKQRLVPICLSILAIATFLPSRAAWVWRTTPFVPDRASFLRLPANRSPSGVLVLGDSAEATPLVWSGIGSYEVPFAAAYTGGVPRALASARGVSTAVSQRCPTSPLGWKEVSAFAYRTKVTTALVYTAPDSTKGCSLPLAIEILRPTHVVRSGPLMELTGITTESNVAELERTSDIILMHCRR